MNDYLNYTEPSDGIDHEDDANEGDQPANGQNLGDIATRVAGQAKRDWLCQTFCQN